MASIGSLLRETRQRKGQSLSDYEEITKIRTLYLKALEDEDFDQLPGHTYAIGFIRSYAKALGLDAQALVDSYKATLVPQEETIKPIEPVDPALLSRRPVTRGLLIIGLCILALLTLFGVNSVWNSGSQPQVKAPAPEVKSAQTTPNSVPQPQVSLPAQPDPQTAPVSSPPQVTRELSLDLNFSSKCWISVKADGQQVLLGNFEAGVSKNVKAKDKIELNVGNAGGVQLVLNGKQLPSLGGQGQVTTKVLTKQDVPQ